MSTFKVESQAAMAGALSSAQAQTPIEHPAKGLHLLLTLNDCAAEVLDNEERIRSITEMAALSTGATVLKVVSQKFDPQGVTACAVLAESHASLHTYPESGVVFFDCFTCGTTCDPRLSIEVLKAELKPGYVHAQLVERG